MHRIIWLTEAKKAGGLLLHSRRSTAALRPCCAEGDPEISLPRFLWLPQAKKAGGLLLLLARFQKETHADNTKMPRQLAHAGA